MDWGLWDVLIVAGISALTTCGIVAALIGFMMVFGPIKKHPMSEMD